MTTRQVRGFGLIGVPTSAGSHNAGQDKAPAAWRAAGLVRRLSERGIEVEDLGDLPVQRHRAAPVIQGVRDLDRVVEIAELTADRVSDTVRMGLLPLVLGGDCTITAGVVAGLRRHRDIGLAYLDGDADLSTPEDTGSGVLDTMGMTHMLGGGAESLAGIGTTKEPLLQPAQVALLGFDPAELSTEQWGRLSALHLHATPVDAVRADPAGAAAAALAHLGAGTDAVLVHFDVDALDTGAFPLADFPHFNGLTLDQVEAVLARLCRSPALAGMVVTEANPDHDPDGTMLATLAALLARVLG